MNKLVVMVIMMLGLAGVVVSSSDYSVNAIESGDDRFGIGSGGHIAKDLDLPWVYNWGHGTYANHGEEMSKNTHGRSVFFTVGKLDNSEDYSGDPNYNIPKLETEYLLDAEDRALYQRLKTIQVKIKTYSGIHEQNSLSSFLLMSKYARENPGMVYGVANEPDLGPYIKPEDFAEYYNIFYRKIKKHDSSAQVMIKGVTLWPGPPGHWNSPSGSTKWWWNDTFREAYKTKFGQYPVIDIWGIHTYSNSNQSWEVIRDRIIGFRNNYLTSIGEQGKPMWLLEFGFAVDEGVISRGVKCGKHGCLTSQEQEQEYQFVVSFMDNLINWMKSTDYVQKWFWFYGGHMYTWTGLDWVSTIYKVPECIPDEAYRVRYNVSQNILLCSNPAKKYNQEYNPLGIKLQRLANSPKLVNKGFESSVLWPYGYSFWPGGTATDYTISIVEDEKNLGNRSAKIHVTDSSNPGPYGYVAAIFQKINNEYYAGKTIKFSARCKTANSGSAGLKINITHSNGVRDSNWLPSVVPPSTCSVWKQIETPRVLIPSDVTSIEFEGYATGKNGTVWFDDFKVEIEPTSSLTPTLGVTACGAGLPTRNLGNANCDGVINILDFAIWYAEYQKYKNGMVQTGGWKADFNNDGKLDLVDLGIWKAGWGI